LDDGGEVRELPREVLELRPGSVGAREGREMEPHGGLVTAAARKFGELVGEPM
jgi:hypothetical protein